MKFGICNEIFDAWKDVDRAIHYVRELGYDGLEVAPFTLAPDVEDISAPMRREVAKSAESAGLEILGIHWVLVGPDGVYLNHPERSVRERTAQYLADLAHFCADIGGTRMIFGSPKQRKVYPGLTYDQAFDFAVETFERALPVLEDRGVTLCMEPLSTRETDFCTSAEETVRLIDRIDHPNFRLLLDTKAMTDEPEGRPATIRRYAKYMAHYHANDENLNGPGWGEVDFGPIFEALTDVGYDEYVSVEVFNFEPGPEAIAMRSLEYMRGFLR